MTIWFRRQNDRGAQNRAFIDGSAGPSLAAFAVISAKAEAEKGLPNSFDLWHLPALGGVMF